MLSPPARICVAPNLSPVIRWFGTFRICELRYTLGPLYAPDRKDAHGDFTEAETLQQG